jgi:excisionase family DNA binding protein
MLIQLTRRLVVELYRIDWNSPGPMEEKTMTFKQGQVLNVLGLPNGNCFDLLLANDPWPWHADLPEGSWSWYIPDQQKGTPDVMTVTEAAHFLRCSPKMIVRLIRRGQLRAANLSSDDGPDYRITKSDALSLLDQKRVRPAQPTEKLGRPTEYISEFLGRPPRYNGQLPSA